MSGCSNLRREWVDFSSIGSNAGVFEESLIDLLPPDVQYGAVVPQHVGNDGIVPNFSNIGPLTFLRDRGRADESTISNDVFDETYSGSPLVYYFGNSVEEEEYSGAVADDSSGNWY